MTSDHPADVDKARKKGLSGASGFETRETPAGDEGGTMRLRRGVGEFEPAPDAFERVLARRDRKRRNQRVAAGVFGIAVFALAVAGGIRLMSSEPLPTDQPAGFLGRWFSFSTDGDGTTQTMTVRPAGERALEIEVHDDSTPVCSGEASTITGSEGIRDDGALVIPAPVLTCDGGYEPEAPSGRPVQEQLRDLSFLLDAETGTLTDTFGAVWTRTRAEEPPTDLEPLWPQTSLEEVRQAQELADAGDLDYTWQVAPYLAEVSIAQHHPYVSWEGGDVVDAEIFARFLEEELGWEEYLWDEAFAHPDDLGPGEVVYIRCAPGLTNPLYPTDPERAGCAPTIDELRYETVQIRVTQFDRQDPSGIWVVTGWEMVEPVGQADPRVVEAETTELLEAFLRARIDGAGAEGFAGFPEDDPFDSELVDLQIPLLYATSTGAPFERSEFELVDGPVWPHAGMQFVVRLFAENDQTVVEQLFSLDRDETDRPRLVYDFGWAPAGSGPGTTENGKAVPVRFGFLDGEVTYDAPYPAAPHSDLWYQAPDVATVVGAHDRRILLILADPQPIEHPGCVEAPAPASAEALARSIRSNPDLDADAPVAVTIGGLPALQIDAVLAPNASECSWQTADSSQSAPLLLKHAPFATGGDRARIYLLDLPGGSARVLALVIFSDTDNFSDEDSFERPLELAAPILDSIEFHAP